jgi:multidrug resistance efflux pump
MTPEPLAPPHLEAPAPMGATATVPQAPAKPRRKPPVALAVGLAAALAVGLWVDFQAGGAVTAASAQAGGPIVNASARLPGLLAEVKLEEGAAVEAGEVVARLDDGDARAALLQAEADLAGAQAALAASRVGVTLQGAQTAMNVSQAASLLAAARAAVRAADATVGQAVTEHARLRGLVGQGVVSAQEVEAARVAIATARADADAARARVAGAEGALRHARATGGEEAVKRDTVEVLRAQLRRAEAAVAIAKLRLDQLAVKAPLPGLVVRRLAHPGETVAAGQPVLAIVDPARLWVTAYVEEAQAPRVREGAPASVRFDALPGKRFAGRVVFVSGTTGDGASLAPSNTAPLTGVRVPQRVPVRVALDAPDPGLRPGMSASVRIEAR